MNTDKINEHYFGDPADLATQRARERIHWICSQVAGRDVLDVGCSQGIVCLILAREGFNCTGIDIEAGPLEAAREALANEDNIVRQRATFQVADASQLPFEAGTFDTVVLGEIIEHLTHPGKVLAEAHRVLRDGGRLVVTVPHGFNAFPDHKRTYYPASLLGLLRPLFKTASTAWSGNYITYAGQKDLAYNPSRIPEEDLLAECERFEAALEVRCLEKERALLETGTKLYTQVRALNAQIAQQGAAAKGLEEALAAKDRQLLHLKNSVEEERRLRREHEDGIAAREARVRELQDRVEHASRAAADLREAVTEQTKRADEFADANAALHRRLAEAEAAHASRLDQRDRHIRSLAAEHQRNLQQVAMQGDAEWKHRVANQRIREVVRVALPVDVRVLVISKGDDDLLRLDGRYGLHFPQGPGGVYAGHHPAKAADAIAHLETLRSTGAQFLLIPASSFWWLEYYAEFRRYLEANYRLLTYSEGTCAIFSLGAPPQGGSHDRLPIAVSKASIDATPGAAARAPEVAQGATVTTGADARAGAPAAPAPEPAVRPAAAAAGVRRATPGRPTLGCVLDEFTAACFAPECDLVTFRPDNWKDVIEREPIDLLLVESAWRGNGGSWQYKVASFQRSMGEELVDLVNHCKSRGIPTVFWNKEDPSHFDRFIHRAVLFDYVFTTDADCIPQYREKAGHDRVFALPFAAQPKIHHPIQDGPRDGAVCFAGTYYGNRFEDRQSDMDQILRPAITFGLDIYDRQHGVSGPGSEAYRFPDVYQPCIKGRLEYDEMVKAYKRYRVFLNVNSVKHSPTMFSRRVFELLACGTPVISTYSRGIAELLGDVVPLVESEADTRRQLERLLLDENEWARSSLRGVRSVMRDHTYGHRLRDVFGRVGLPLPEPPQPTFSVVVRVDSAAELKGIAAALAAQTYRRFDVVLLSKSVLSVRALEPLRRALPDSAELRVVRYPGRDAFERCVGASGADFLAFLNPGDSYGPNYLMDHAIAATYAVSDFQGKRTYFERRGRGKPRIVQPGSEFTYAADLNAATVVARRKVITNEVLRQVLEGSTFTAPSDRVLSIDRFNYLKGVPSEEGVMSGKSRSGAGVLA